MVGIIIFGVIIIFLLYIFYKSGDIIIKDKSSIVLKIVCSLLSIASIIWIALVIFTWNLYLFDSPSNLQKCEPLFIGLGGFILINSISYRLYIKHHENISSTDIKNSWFKTIITVDIIACIILLIYFIFKY